MQLSTLFFLVATLAIPANAYFILSHPVLETTRLDPIVSPGEISGHVHSIVGGNNFNRSMTYASTQDATCTTASVTVDKSSYWTPQLYYYSPSNGSFEMITVSFVNTYYLPRYSSGETTVSAFPDGLRMISGDMSRRTFTEGDPDSEAISYVCLDYDNDHTDDDAWAQRNSFFEHSCPDGMRAQVNFRSCWDGVNLDSDDHQSHMSWPSGGVDGGDCPTTHPVRLVSLFYEFIYNVQDFPYNDDSNITWVFSTGDTTGYSMHGDFINGWPAKVNGSNVLQLALDQCNDDNGVGGELDQCPPFVDYIDSDAANACKPLNEQVDEDIGDGDFISKLPGDNLLWTGNTSKPTNASYSNDGIGFTDFLSTIPDGYTYTGCIAEGTSGRALTGASFTSDNMTRGVCVQWCEDQSFPLAAVEYGDECYCGVSLMNGATNTTLLTSSKCSMSCADNDNEVCGGSSTLNLYNNLNLYPNITYPDGWSSYGCITEATNVRALASYSTSGTSMTPQTCMNTCHSKGYMYAGVEYSDECYCGNSFGTGSAITDDTECDMSCSGDDLQMCGGSSVLSAFVYSNTTLNSTTTSVASTVVASTSKSTTATSTSATSTSKSATSTSTSATSTSKSVTSTSASATSTSKSATSTSASATSASATSTSKSVTSTSASATSTSKSVTSTSASATSTSKSATSTSASATSTSKSATSTSKSVTSTSASSTSTSKSATSTSASATSTSKSATSTSASATSTSKSATSTSASATSTSASATSTSKSATSTSTSTSSTASASSTASSISDSYLGCYSDYTPRHLNGSHYTDSTSMTNEVCIAYCTEEGYAFAGTEYAEECWCGDYLNEGVYKADSHCTSTCKGDSTETCGAGGNLSIYTTGLDGGVYMTGKYSRRSLSTKRRQYNMRP